MIHGGPQGAWLDSFHTRWNIGLYASSGFVTIAINPHGSTGFGQPFQDSIRDNWGGSPYQDIIKGVEYALNKYTFIDPNRLAALGASYGGYMINWINGHTNIFKCLVNHDGLFDMQSFYYTTEELWFPEWEMVGTPWENPEAYQKWSPSKYVHKWKTPCLVIHGGTDFRVPLSEGIATFTALQRQGIPSEFLYFPTENHWVLSAANSILWHDSVLEWLNRWIGPHSQK